MRTSRKTVLYAEKRVGKYTKNYFGEELDAMKNQCTVDQSLLNGTLRGTNHEPKRLNEFEDLLHPNYERALCAFLRAFCNLQR